MDNPQVGNILASYHLKPKNDWKSLLTYCKVVPFTACLINFQYCCTGNQCYHSVKVGAVQKF
jgi:hypothetical protein